MAGCLVDKNAVSVDIGSDGVAAPNTIDVDFVGQVAPCLPGAETHNTVRDVLQVVGCCTLPDECFEYGSSFVVPGARQEFSALFKLRDDLAQPVGGGDPQKPPISIFGHTDPVASTWFNFGLSKRRAMAVYAILIRDLETWDTLYKEKFESDEWTNDHLNRILVETCNRPPLAEDEEMPDPQRQALFLEYMNWLCTNDDDITYKLDAEGDFLARGKHEKAKGDVQGDVQGCGESNLQLILSKEEDDPKTEEEKALRNEKNRPNRRVIAYLFKPGSEIDPEIWPCPAADISKGKYDWDAQQAKAKCEKRFWYKHEDRIKQDETKQRRFRDNQDTFSCRFYQGIARNSPCECATRLWVIQLLESTPWSEIDEDVSEMDENYRTDHRRPLADRRFVVKLGDSDTAPVVRGVSDWRGFIRIPVVDYATEMDMKVEMYKKYRPDGEEPEEERDPEEDEKYFMPVRLNAGQLRDIDTGLMPPKKKPAGGSDPQSGEPPPPADGTDAEKREAAKQRLYNLGYGPVVYEEWTDEDLDEAVKDFKRNEKLVDDGEEPNADLDEPFRMRIRQVHEPVKPLNEPEPDGGE